MRELIGTAVFLGFVGCTGASGSQSAQEGISGPSAKASMIRIVGASDFIVPGSGLNVIRYDVDPADFAFTSVKIEVSNARGAIVATLSRDARGKTLPTGGSNRVFWNGLDDLGSPLPQAGSPYSYTVVGIDRLGATTRSGPMQASVEEHKMSLVIDDFSPIGLTGKVDPTSLENLETSVTVDGAVLPKAFVGYGVRTKNNTPRGEQVLAYLYDGPNHASRFVFFEDRLASLPEPRPAPHIFYTTPTVESTIRYSIHSVQKGKFVRDIVGNPWNMNPNAKELHDFTTLRFGINPRSMPTLTNHFERITGTTGAAIQREPDPPGIFRLSD